MMNKEDSVFQSALIAVARLTTDWPPLSYIVSVSIRFHRGGPSHFPEEPQKKPDKRFNPLSSRWPVSHCLVH